MPTFLDRAKPVGTSFLGRAQPVDAPPPPQADAGGLMERMRQMTRDLGGADLLGEAAPVIADAAADTSAIDAGAAITVADKLGVHPSYVADSMPEAQATLDKQQFTRHLATAGPALAAFAAQSPQHAAFVREDAGALARLEGWFTNGFRAGLLDIGHAEAMRRFMQGDKDSMALGAFASEQKIAEYDKQDHGYVESMGRAAPQMIMYAGAGQLAGPAGLAGLMYLQNKGTLARTIQLGQFNKEGELPEGATPLTDKEIDDYATAGSAAGSAVLAGFMGPLLRSFPGARQRLAGLSMSLLSKAATTSVGQAAVRQILAWGGHTAMGALGMVLQGTINSATVQKATQGEVDPLQLAREAAAAAPHALTVAATFGAFGPARDFMADRARLQMAPQERAKLDAMVENARELAKKNPDLAGELFGMMGRGLKVYVSHQAAAHLLPDISLSDLAAAEAAQDTVAVPMEEYLSKHVDKHDTIKDDVKLTRDGLTMNEARLQDDKMRQALTQEQARVLYGSMTPDEMIGLEKMPIAADMGKELAKKLGPDAQKDIKTGAARPGNVAPPGERDTGWHGTKAEFNTFDDSKRGGYLAFGHSVGDSKDVAEKYAGRSGKVLEVKTPPRSLLLDFNKPMSEQSPEVIQRLKDAGIWEDTEKFKAQTGNDLYYGNKLQGGQEASDALLKMGIKGTAHNGFRTFFSGSDLQIDQPAPTQTFAVPPDGRPGNVAPDALPQEWVHGTSEANAELIKGAGAFNPAGGQRQYDYSEFGRGAVYFGPPDSTWANANPGSRNIKYSAKVKAVLAPGAKVLTIRTPADALALAKRMGFKSYPDLENAWFTDGLLQPHTGISVEEAHARSDATTKKFRDLGYDALFVADYDGKDPSNFDMPSGNQLAVFNHDVIKPKAAGDTQTFAIPGEARGDTQTFAVPPDGRPAFHGSKADFNAFDDAKPTNGTFGSGHYSSASPDIAKVSAGEGGQLHSVRVPPASKMLQWKGPLTAEQRAFADSVGAPHAIGDGILGQGLYDFLQNKFGDKQASQMLHDAGILGIDYEARGSLNHVVFKSENIPSVAREMVTKKAGTTAQFPSPGQATPGEAGGTLPFSKPGDTIVTPSLHEVMAAEYGGTPEEWGQRLSHELLQAMGQEGSLGAISPEEHAARVIDATPIQDIQPGYFSRLAAKAAKYIQTAAEQARTGLAAGVKKGTEAKAVADVAILHTYELAKAVNEAKAKRAAEVQAEMQASLDTITKQSKNDKVRAQLGMAGKPLLRLFDALAGGVAEVKPGQISEGWRSAYEEATSMGHTGEAAQQVAADLLKSALPDALEVIDANAGMTKFDVPAVQRFLDNPRPWGDLKPPEARNLHDAIKQLLAQSKDAGKALRADQKATVDELGNAIIPELRQNPSKGLPAPSGSVIPWYKRLLSGANAANGVFLRAKDNLGQKSATLKQWVFDPIMDAAYARDKMFSEIAKRAKAAADEMPADVRDGRLSKVDLSDRLSIPGQAPLNNVDRTYLWKLARHWMSSGNMERVTSMNGWDRDVVSKILFDDADTKLSVHEWDYLQKIADIHEEMIWPLLKSHMEEHYGIASPKVAGVPFKVELPDGTFKEYAGGYAALTRDPRGEAPPPILENGTKARWGPDFEAPHVPGAAQDRNEGSHYLVNMNWSTEMSTIAKTVHWLTFDQPVRSVDRVLSHPPIAAAMREYMGEGRADNVEGWLASNAQQMSESTVKGQEIINSYFGFQRGAALAGAVLGSAKLALQAAAHPILLMAGGKINPIFGIPHLIQAFSPIQIKEGEIGVGKAWTFAYDNSSEVQRRTDRTLDDCREGMLASEKDAPAGPIGKLLKFARWSGGLGIHAADTATTRWAFNSAYDHAIGPAHLGGLEMEPMSKEAFDYASGVTQDVMPAHDRVVAAPAFSNRQVGMFLMMQGFRSAIYNMLQGSIASSVKDFHQAQTFLPSKETGAPSTVGASLRAAGKVALGAAMLGSAATISKVLSGYAQEEGESKKQWLGRTILAALADPISVPGVSTVAEIAAKLAVGEKPTRRDFNMMNAPGAGLTLKVLDLLGKLVNENREPDQKTFDVIETALYGAPLPSRSVRVASEHLYKMIMGEEYDGDDSVDAAGKFIYTDKQWDSIKRTLSPDED